MSAAWGYTFSFVTNYKRVTKGRDPLVALRMPREMRNDSLALAEATGRTFSAVVRDALSEALKTAEKVS